MQCVKPRGFLGDLGDLGDFGKSGAAGSLPHRLGLRPLLVQIALQSHLIELLLQSIDSASLDGLRELSVVSLVEAELPQFVGQPPVDPGEVVEDLLRMAPWVVRLGGLHRHL